MSKQKLSVDKFAGIALVVLAFLFIGPCVSNPTIPIDNDVVISVGRKTLLKEHPNATILEDNTTKIVESGKIVYVYGAKFSLSGETKIRTFVAKSEQD